MKNIIPMPLATIPSLETLFKSNEDIFNKINIASDLYSMQSVKHEHYLDKLTSEIRVGYTRDSGLLQRLECRLSEYFRQTAQPLSLSVKRTSEEAVCLGKISGIHCEYETPLPIKALISEISTDLGGGGFRDGAIYSAPDRAGYRIVYPAHRLVENRLNEIERIFSDADGKYHQVAAIVGIVLFFNAHPLRDGNGRVGRVLYNMKARRSPRHQAAYLPLYEFIRLLAGGFNYATRMAWINNEWRPVLHWFLSAHIIAYRLCKRLSIHET